MILASEEQGYMKDEGLGYQDNRKLL